MTSDLIAHDLVKRGKLTESLEYLDEAINNSIGDQLRLYEDRAYVYLSMGDNISAFRDFTNALLIEPKSNYSLFNRAMINFSAGKFDAALSDFNLISETNLLKDKYWILGKDLFSKTKNYVRSLYFTQRLCAYDKENYHYIFHKAFCLSKIRSYKESILTYQSLIGKASNQYLIYNNLGFVYILNGEILVAEEYLKKGLALFPDNAFINSNISIVYYFKKEYHLALRHIETSIKNGPSNPLAYFLRSKYFLHAGKVHDARKDMELAIKLGLNNDLATEKNYLENTIFKV